MFVRAKTIKGKKYGYLVENSWVKGKVRQKVKQYLGKIIPLPPLDSIEPLTLEGSKEQRIRSIILHDLASRGCTVSDMMASYDQVSINLDDCSILEDDKPAVVMINKRYCHGDMLKELIEYYEPEGPNDKPGHKLAKAFKTAGIVIHPQNFVDLYKFLMSLDTQSQQEQEKNN